MLPQNNFVCCSKCNTEHISQFNIRRSDKRSFQGECKNCQETLKFQLNHFDDKGLLEKDTISFSINGNLYTVGNKYPVTMTLNQYLRNELNMTGTKVTCKEGGCGACLINSQIFDPQTQTKRNISINTCLVPLYSCDGLNLTTIEGVGSKSKGFNEIQKRLADNNGSQCGWCTTGMVMNMYSLLLEDPTPSMDKIEAHFDGNICRCTGYRSILEAMRSFAGEKNPIDIEELSTLRCLNDNPNVCRQNSRNNNLRTIHLIESNNLYEWFTPSDMDSLYKLLVQYQKTPYKLVSGNTGTGVFKNDGPYQTYIYLKNIDELYNIKKTSNQLVVGSQLSLKSMIDLFTDYSIQQVGFEYLSEIASHFRKIANVSVRNTGTWSGNLVLKHLHPIFQSDVYICLETIGALINLVGPDKFDPSINVTPKQLMNESLEGKLIYAVKLQAYDKSNTFIRTYKVMPRSQNSHAYVNAGFRVQIDSNMIVQGQPCLVFGGISETFTHATQTEKFLTGQCLSDQNVLTQAFALLSSELQPTDDPVMASPDYRRSLATSLFFKFVLYLNQNRIAQRNKSALTNLIDARPLSTATQSFPTQPSLYPVTKPIAKLNARLQASGEALYMSDKRASKTELHGAFILSAIGAARIDKIDTTLATQIPGVYRVILAGDIPGVNTFTAPGFVDELLFCYDQVDYAGQPVGLVLANTLEIAKEAAKVVKVTYKEQKTPILSVFDAIKASSFFPKTTPDFIYGDAEQAIKTAPRIIEGECFLDTQFHFFMESHIAICELTEDGIEVSCATQWLDFVQAGVARALGLANRSSVDVKVRQVGGGYGGKITRANIGAVAAAVACHVTQRPCRVEIDLNTTMVIHGKRFPWYAKYQIGFDLTGKILGIIANLFCDAGNSPNGNFLSAASSYIDNAYSCKNWHIICELAKTNLPNNTSTRSTFPSIAIMENMIDHVARSLNADPLRIRQINLYKKNDVTPVGQPLPYFNVDVLIDKLKQSSDYENRCKQVDDFNEANRWKKKGISMTPIKWAARWNKSHYNCLIAICATDGSVCLTQGGIEVGQGIHTKVSQVCAYELGIPIDLISIKYADTLTDANGRPTGGSITSELCSQAVIECCKIINTNLEPVRKQMPDKYTWPDLIVKAFSLGIDLTARYWSSPTSDTPYAYECYGAAVSEAIIDVLTGECQIMRTDILYDGGQSLNGEIDIGQAEGAFVMGMGFWLMEKVRYDPSTGVCLTNGTWEYKPPTTKDIPVDFRVTFLDQTPNPGVGVLGSKCIGEPPLCLSPCVAFAVKRAIETARNEIGNEDFFALNSPATVEAIQQLCLVDYKQFLLG